MAEETFEHIVFSKNVIEFVTVANEYCAFLEKHEQHGRREFVEKIQKLFPLLYLKAGMLPEVQGDNAETPEKFLSEVDYNFLLNNLTRKLAQFDSYKEVFDEGMQFSEEALESSISENICDIYQDLKDFLVSYRIGDVDIMNDALWECQNNFKNYWGQRLVNALRAIHNLIYGEQNLDEGEEITADEEELDTPEFKSDSWVKKHFNNYSDENEME